ncbi:MAG: hypothetical protein HYY20_03685 [Candidatus Tectomicrobia bacterium]|uniref:Uncharacterized protein n=1 Tax=Tectimicrobiota bacterium TaxID=2528274 RepID=A0A932CMQ3_UNCTE|nr:hypothetical protein [Candidatus Tectomicrobia bacterium]
MVEERGEEREEKRRLVEKVVTSTEDSVTIGETTLPLAELVDDPQKYGKLIVDIITNDEWVEKRFQQLRPHLDPFVQIQDMDAWDRQNFERYPLDFAPMTTRCGFCGQRSCDLSGERPGHCGLTLDRAIALYGLKQACAGAQRFIHQARLLYTYAVDHLNPKAPIDLGYQIYYRCPNIMMITGLFPEKLSDLQPVLDYVEREIIELAAAATWQTNLSAQELEIRTYQVGTISFVAMEVSEMVNIVAMGHTSAGHHDIVALQKWPLPETPVGVGSIDRAKFVIMFVGTADIIAWELAKRVQEQGLAKQVELCGVGDAGIKLSRIYPGGKVLGIGPHLLKFLRLGIPDLIVYDGECTSVDIEAEARRLGIPAIIPSKIAFSLAPNLTRQPLEAIVGQIAQDPAGAFGILDYPKAAEVILALRKRLPRRREGLYFAPGDLAELSRPYTEDLELDCLCPAEMDLSAAFQAAAQGDPGPLRRQERNCLYCGRCEQRTVGAASPLELLLKACKEELRMERSNMRAGRGPTTHVEYRDAAFAVVAGAPGFVTLAGCGDAPHALEDIAWIAEECAALGCAVSMAGCTGIAAGSVKDAQGKTIYERRYATIQVRGVVNIGECSAACHCFGGYTKLTVLAGRIAYRANYLEIIDRLLNKWPTVTILWGATSERFAAMAAGWVRAGIPVIVGPSGQEFLDRLRLGDHLNVDRWWLYDHLDGQKRYVEPGKRHLLLPVSTREEAVNMAVKLLMAPCDLWIMREAKLMHYVDTYRLLDREMPDDWQYYVRHPMELTTRLRFKLLRDLEKKGWDVIVKKGAILSFKRPNGEVVSFEEFSQKYRIASGASGVRLPKLIHKE